MLIRVEKNINNKNLLNSLKKKFKKIMKNNKRLYEKGEFYKITKIIKEKNSENFFKKAKNLSNKKTIKIDMDIEQIAINYGLIFNDSLKIPQIHIDLINN